jgi:anaerobic ribonucleoside-triphosphate reductase activating protein
MEYESHKWGESIYLYPTLTMTDVIVDGRFINEQKDANYPYAGSTNQRVIDMRKSFEGDSSTGQWLNGDCVVLYKE